MQREVNARRSRRKTWTSALSDIDKAPWPGPRPIELAKDELAGAARLHGRDLDSDRFLAAVIDHLLVVLTADSGVGKSSLLNAGLRPRLEAEGFRVTYISKWEFQTDETPRAFIGKHVVDELGDATLGDPRHDGFWTKVDDTYGDRLVVVLDQFEELVRFQASAFRKTLEWIRELNRRHSIRAVISLRADYHHQLRELERDARPFTMTTHRLEPVTGAEHVQALIEDCDQKIGTIESAAVSKLLKLWEEAQSDDERPGLLHMQAILYVLYHRARNAGRTVVMGNDVGELASAAGDLPFEYGLRESVRTKLEHCRVAARTVGLDRFLVDGTDAMVQRIIPRLSSGGFKLVLDEWTIATQVLAAELKRVRAADGVDPRAVYDDVRARCFVDGEIAPDPWPDGYFYGRERWQFGPRYPYVGWAPWKHDPRDVSSGPMLGMPPDTVMFQELRRFAFAMSWLDESSLVRRSSPKPGTTIVALIHDGFGRALESLSEHYSESFTHAMARLTGARGEELDWDGEGIEQFCDELGTSGPTPLINVRWRDCTVADVKFENFVFVNADLRGTRFAHCTFDGVTFVNCLLDNAVFSDCEIVGGVSSKTLGKIEHVLRDGDREMPDFVIDAPPGEVDVIARYRAIPPELIGNNKKKLYSRTSGIAAHPAQPGAPQGIRMKATGHGLVVYGGRLNSLMLSGCRFVPDVSGTAGTVALRHIAGAALDFAEHTGGRLELFDSTMRGLTVSAPEPKSRKELTETEVNVVSAIVANLWFDADVRGSVRFHDTIVTQLVNCSQNLEIMVENTPKTKNIAVGDVGAPADLKERFLDVPPSLEPPWDAYAAMDYRSRPAETELEGRPIKQ